MLRKTVADRCGQASFFEQSGTAAGGDIRVRGANCEDCMSGL